MRNCQFGIGRWPRLLIVQRHVVTKYLRYLRGVVAGGVYRISPFR